ncbi:MAG: AsmA-like C-terminal region-containing protein, partial [Thiohalobacterales bacterium]|nr:AsmA-like C-terminal region-containing protein [Thiohalobacterales bacterium]
PLSIKVGNVAHAERWVSVDYGDMLRALLQLRVDDGGIALGRGTLTLGGGTAALRDRDGLLINGRLAALRLSEWAPWLKGGQGGPPFPVSAELDIGELELMHYTLDDLRLDADFAGRVWSMSVSGESTRGDVQLTQGLAGLEKVVMNMERLTVSGSAGGKGARDGQIRPADVPEVQVTTGRFIYNGTDFGELDLKTVAPADNLYRIERLALSSALLDMRLEGEWLMAGDRHQSRVDVDITDGKMDELLTALGYEKTIEGGRVFGRLQAAWPAPVWEVAPEIIDGKLELVIKDGQLLDIDPGAGRALGLFDLGRLPRRLTLDFSDLFSEGFKFDRIGGNFVLDYGNIYTTDLKVDGAAAKIEISGRVGLADRDYDQLVTVTPYIESSLPLAGAIAGGPAVGAVAVVAEKLLQGKLGLNRMAQKQYTVTGSWDAPVVTRLEPEPAPGEQTEVADVFDE